MEDIKVGEIWKDIIDFPNYLISNYGRVKSKERITKVGIKNVKQVIRKEKILKPLKITKGYLGIRLYNNLDAKTFKIYDDVDAVVDGTIKVSVVNRENIVGSSVFCLLGSSGSYNLDIICRNVSEIKGDFDVRFEPGKLWAVEKDW